MRGFFNHIWYKLLNEEGIPISGASIWIYDYENPVDQLILFDENENQLTQPIFTDTEGIFDFYVKDHIKSETNGYVWDTQFIISWSKDDKNGIIRGSHLFGDFDSVNLSGSNERLNKAISNFIGWSIDTHVDFNFGRTERCGSSSSSSSSESSSSSSSESSSSSSLSESSSSSSESVEPIATRGVFGGGDTGGGGSDLNNIDYITINSLGNASNFGDLTNQTERLSSNSNGINDRGIFGGGHYHNDIDYITISSESNASSFGELLSPDNGIRHSGSATSNGTNERGVFGGGYNFNGQQIIDYITINSTGNSIDFGDLTNVRQSLAATSNGTNERGVFGGGNSIDIIDYITINSLGNASDFGDLTIDRVFLSATSNTTNERGVFGGGNQYIGAGDVNIIDYITINSLGNASDFGDLTIVRIGLAATSNGTNERGVFGGGLTGDPNPPGPTYNNIDYITINSLGNASDFGDLTANKKTLAACANA